MESKLQFSRLTSEFIYQSDNSLYSLFGAFYFMTVLNLLHPQVKFYDHGTRSSIWNYAESR